MRVFAGKLAFDMIIAGAVHIAHDVGTCLCALSLMLGDSLRLVQFDEGQGGNSKSAELAYEVLAAASAVLGEGESACGKADAEFIQNILRPEVNALIGSHEVAIKCLKAGDNLTEMRMRVQHVQALLDATPEAEHDSLSPILESTLNSVADAAAAAAAAGDAQGQAALAVLESHLHYATGCYQTASAAATRAVHFSNEHIDCVGPRTMAAAARCGASALLKLKTPHTDAQAMDLGLLEVACAQKGDVVQQLHAMNSLADAQLRNKKFAAAAASYRDALGMIAQAPKVAGADAEAEAAVKKGREQEGKSMADAVQALNWFVSNSDIGGIITISCELVQRELKQGQHLHAVDW